MVRARGRGGQIAAMSAPASAMTVRHSEGGLRVSGGKGAALGGGVGRIVLHGVDEQGEQEVRVQLGAGEPLVLGGA